MNKKFTVIDLFSGCGGMSLGFQNSGFEIISAYDNWDAAIDVYRDNFNHPIYKRDLSDLSILDELQNIHADMIIGGPPCQDFSIAGKRDFDGNRANLTLIYSQIIQKIKPKWFLMENVYNIEKSGVLHRVLANFKQAGYGITSGVFEASFMGVPQNRKRYFAIGKLGAEDDFIAPLIHQKLALKRLTVREYLGTVLDCDYYYMHPRSYKRRAIFSLDEPSSTIRGVNRPMPSSYIPHPADKTKDIDSVRSLTTKERSLIQTFPNDFIFNGTKSNLEQVIGNAVPVKMAEFFAKIILEKFE